MKTDKDLQAAAFGEKIHPWRMCAKGYHFRGGTNQKIELFPSDKKTGTPNVTTVFDSKMAKCVKNDGFKDRMHPVEMVLMTGAFLSQLSTRPLGNNLGFSNGNEFDIFILGWVQYWNEIFKPKTNLEPLLVKALIASESGFDPSAPKNNKGSANGLMQITEVTRKALGDFEGELKDHLVIISKEEIYNPTVNICAGVRWLFRKREILQGRSKKKEVNWEDVVYLYKSADKNPKVMGPFGKYLKQLREKM